jgi:hypothetical protein
MDEQALNAAQALYEMLLNEGTPYAEDFEYYKTSRRTLVQRVGRDALPPLIRDCQTLGEARSAIRKNEEVGWNRHKFLRAEFDPLFQLLESVQPESAPARPEPAARLQRGLSVPPIFISHRSGDLALVGALVDLLTFAMRLEPDAIRCTSLPGHDLAGGERTDDRLRQEIASAELFLALVTPGSLRSHFVLFELGARWGIEPLLEREPDASPRFIPLTGRGIDAGKLPRPLADFNCLDLRVSEDIAQLLAVVSKILHAPLVSEAARGRYVRRVIDAASDIPEIGRYPDYHLRVLRALFGETGGRLLTSYREHPEYKMSIAALIADGLIRENHDRLVLTDRGREAVTAYLATL